MATLKFPTLPKGITHHEPKNSIPRALEAHTNSFISSLKRGHLAEAGLSKALETVDFLQALCGKGRWTSVSEMIVDVRRTGRRLMETDPTDMILGNLVRRVLHIIREEFQASFDSNVSGVTSLRPELATFLVASPVDFESSMSGDQFKDFKARVIEGIDGLKLEVLNVYDSITVQAETHIHHKEVILVSGYSSTVLKFVVEAARKGLALEVFVAEGNDCRGHDMAKKLAEMSTENIQVTLIADAAVFALMPRINLVVLGARAVLANGGLQADCGTHVLTLAAKQFSVPVIVCAGLYKLSPLFPSSRNDFNLITSPSHCLPNPEMANYAQNVESINPRYDYVPPELIRLFVTGGGSYNSTYIYRLLADLYSEADYDIETE